MLSWRSPDVTNQDQSCKIYRDPGGFRSIQVYESLQIPTSKWSTANSDPCLVMPGAGVCLESVSVISRDLEIQC